MVVGLDLLFYLASMRSNLRRNAVRKDQHRNRAVLYGRPGGELRFRPKFQNRCREHMRRGVTKTLDCRSSLRVALAFCVPQPLVKTGEINHEGHEGHERNLLLAARHGERRTTQDMQLDLRETFYFYRNVPAVNDGASGSAIAQSTQDGPLHLLQRIGALVLAAQGESTEANAALEKL